MRESLVTISLAFDSVTMAENSSKQSHPASTRRILSMSSQSAMPETTTAPRSDASFPRAPTSARKETGGQKPSIVERNLARCVRRKLTYSQVPVRCQRPCPYRRPPVNSPFKIAVPANITRLPLTSPKSLPECSPIVPTLPAIGIIRHKRSLSMIDLTPITVDPEIGEHRITNGSPLGHHDDANERAKEIIVNGTTRRVSNGKTLWTNDFGQQKSDEGGVGGKAADLVCHFLVLNAWRKRRGEVVQLRETVDRLDQQIEHLHIQIVVLRRLLETENSRVGRLTNELHQAKMRTEESNREKEILNAAKEKLEEESKHTEEISEQRLVTMENLRNELNTARDQLQALDAQITKEREKLLKLREDKRILLDKVSASEAIATERGSRAERAESAAEDLQIRLAAQIALVESAQQKTQYCAKELKTRQEEKQNLERRLRLSEEEGKALRMRAAALESELADKEAALRRVESACSLQMMELNELRERLLRQSQESGWSSRVLQIAGSVVRVPRALLRTLSFLSANGAPMTL